MPANCKQQHTTLGALIRRLSADDPARRVPTRQECRFCDITAEDCAERVESDDEALEGNDSRLLSKAGDPERHGGRLE